MVKSKRTGIASILVILLLFPLILIGQDEEIQEMYQEYMQLNQQIQIIQQEALQDDAVAEIADDYQELVDRKISEIDPQAAGLIERRDETIDALQEAQEKGDMETLQLKQQEYQQINGELRTYEEIVMQDETVQVKRQEFETVLIAKMEEIDPDVMQTLQRMQQLGREIERMMQEPR